MKHLPFIVALCSLLPAVGLAQQAVPESPAIWREVNPVVFTDPANLAGPVFTRPHMPAFRTTADGRIGTVVENYGGDATIGEKPAFTLLMPEKMTTPFVLNPGGNTDASFTMSKTTPNPASFARLNVANQYASAPLNNKDFTGNDSDPNAGTRKSPGMVCLWDPGDNPQVVGGKDVYNISVMVIVNSGTSPDNRTQFFVTPVKITVINPKTINAAIEFVEKTGPTVAGPEFGPNATSVLQFEAEAYEPMIVGDGRLLVCRIGSANLKWTDPNTGLPGSTSGHANNIVYSYYTGGNAADPTQWTELLPISFAPYDNRINTKFGFAMSPFRDAAGTVIPGGEDFPGSYPWMDRGAKNLFFVCVGGMLQYSVGGLWDKSQSRYPQDSVTWNGGGAAPTGLVAGGVEEPAEFEKGETDVSLRGVSVAGLWTHGKVVLLDNLNNFSDYQLSYFATSSSGNGHTPRHRMVNIFQPNSGPFENESGWLLLGYGRANNVGGKLPPGENTNSTIIDSLENVFNYRKEAFPLTRRDVVWPLSNGAQSDEVVFDDYLDPDAFIVANMAGLVTLPTNYLSITTSNSPKYYDGWRRYGTGANAFVDPVKLQNAATSTTDRWLVPKHGLVVGNGRLEPAATGGVHGKGFSMDGNIGLEFTVDAQPQNVTTKDWYVGIFVDCRFANGTIERRLITFPDGTSIRLYGRSQVLYVDAAGNVVNRISLPPIITPQTHPLDDLLPDSGWAHLAFQISAPNTKVDFYLNGIIYSRWEDAYQQLFTMVPGKLTVGKVASSSVTGFTGWIDDFKVLAHSVDFETACNHANGSLIGLPNTYAESSTNGYWRTKFANRYPAWAQTEITNALKNNGETTYPKYASFYNYTKDHGAHRDNIPAGTIWLRQSIHFPEGPLFHNRPRPDSVTNTFCRSCHHQTGKGGLDLAALDFVSTLAAKNDPRRQPMQPPPMVFGRIPASFVNNTTPTNQPTALTDLSSAGKFIDEWQLAAFNNSATVQSFTIVDAATRKDLMTLTAGATVDPAKLGTTNLTIRANLSTAQGNVVMQLGSAATNTKTKPPYTAFGSDANPWVGQVLTPGTHTIKATPQFGSLSSLSFTVAGNTTRVIAGYRADFKTHSPQSGWSYLWNALGPITSAANYRTLNYRTAGTNYTINGVAAFQDPDSPLGPWLNLHDSGGHPGRGVNDGATYDRFAIAAYTVKLAGYYGVSSGFVKIASTTGNGGQVVIYTETNLGATFTQKFSNVFVSGVQFNFSTNVGLLQPGDTIYVGIGPNQHSGADTFTHDFNIIFNETANPL